jgi:mycarose O-acyltransferase
MDSQSQKTFFPSLQVCRFFAALLVVLHHVASGWPHSTFLYNVYIIGDIGVSFFFMLSGFVLMFNYRQGISYKEFILRRIIRIFPIHIICTTIAILSYHFFKFSLAGYIDSGTIFEKICNYLLIHAWLPLQWSDKFSYLAQTLNGVSWTLSCELFFYLLAPFIFKYLLKLDLKSLIIVFLILLSITLYILVLSLNFFSEIFIYFLKITPYIRICEFIFGSICAGILKLLIIKNQNSNSIHFKTERLSRLIVIIFLFAIISYICCYIFLYGYLIADFFQVYIFVPSFISIVFSLAYYDYYNKSYKIFSNKVLLSLGDSSFILYMIHALFLGYFVYKIKTTNFFNLLPSNEIITLIYLVIVVSMALVIYKYIDSNIQRKLKCLFRL